MEITLPLKGRKLASLDRYRSVIVLALFMRSLLSGDLLVRADDPRCLRPFVALLFPERHGVPNLQVVEISAHHAVAVKVQFAAVRGLDEPVTAFRKELGHETERRFNMRFHFAVHFLRMAFELPFHGIKGVPDRDVDVFVFIPVDQELRSGYGEIDSDIEQLALLMPALRLFDRHPAGHDPAEEPLQLGHTVVDLCDHCVRMRYILELDDGCDYHCVTFPLSGLACLIRSV